MAFHTCGVASWRLWLASAAFLVAALGDACSASSSNGSSYVAPGGAPNPAGEAGPSGLSEDASACRPGDVQTYEPPAYQSAAAAWQGVCSQAGIDGFYNACLGPAATPAACTAFSSDPATALCAACILTPDTATHYGPLINHGTLITTNVGGCIELTDRNGLACAKAEQALSGCELAACQANCPVHDPASRAAYDTCAQQAAQAGCQRYEMAGASCIDTAQDAGLLARCFGQTFGAFYNAAVPLFCGAPESPLDAGAPPSFDGSFDAARDALSDASMDVQQGLGEARSDAYADGSNE